MGYICRPGGGGHGSSTRGKRAVAKKAKKSRAAVRAPGLNWGMVVVSPEDFDALEKCNTTPRAPTQSIVEGAEQLRRLYRKG